MGQHSPEVPGGSNGEGMLQGDGLGVALVQEVVAWSSSRRVAHQEWEEEEREEQRGTLVSHGCFKTQLADVYFS